MTLRIHTSNVAALIGKHKYRPKEKAFLQCWKHNDPTGYHKIRKLIEKEDRDVLVKQIIHASGADEDVRLAIQSSNPSEMDTYVQLIDNAVEQHIARAALNVTPEEIKKDICSLIYTSKGIAQEETCLDTFETDVNVPVTHRNDKTYTYKGGNYTLVGKIDGIQQVDGTDVVIENKFRMRRLFHYVPHYERIQILCYLQLTQCPQAKLVQFFGETHKSTDIFWDEKIWERINNGLIDVANEYYCMMEDTNKQKEFMKRYL